MKPLKSPVVFIIFNRPELTQIVFNRIKEIKPERLLIIADGPRSHISGEKEKCEKVRKIVQDIDWPCKVEKNYSEMNLGCRKRVSSGITWAFERVEEAIIIEDDCLPALSFFQYCDELLDLFRHNPQVMMIGADCRYSLPNYPYSYYFERTPYIWAWATWKRAWNKYDVEMKDWPDFDRKNSMKKLGWKPFVVNYYRKHWQRTFKNKIDTWDYQWVYTIMKNNGACIHPQVNLVKNLGFGPEATHTKIETTLANRKTMEITFPLKHPPEVSLSWELDHSLQKLHQAWWPRIVNRIKGFFLSLQN